MGEPEDIGKNKQKNPALMPGFFNNKLLFEFLKPSAICSESKMGSGFKALGVNA